MKFKTLEGWFQNASSEETEMMGKDLENMQEKLRDFDRSFPHDSLKDLGEIFYSSRNDVILLARWAFEELKKKQG